MWKDGSGEETTAKKVVTLRGDDTNPSNATEYFPPCSSDLSPADVSLGKTLQRKLYRQEVKDIDHLKRVLLHCRVLWSGHKKRCKTICVYWLTENDSTV